MNKAGHLQYNVGESNYSTMPIQPWELWDAWSLDPWDADIVKRIARTKVELGCTLEESMIEDYEKIKHICDHQIYRIQQGLKLVEKKPCLQPT